MGELWGTSVNKLETIIGFKLWLGDLGRFYENGLCFALDASRKQGQSSDWVSH